MGKRGGGGPHTQKNCNGQKTKHQCLKLWGGGLAGVPTKTSDGGKDINQRELGCEKKKEKSRSHVIEEDWKGGLDN